MLVTYANYNNAPFNWQPTLHTLDPLRASFAQNLVNKGYPQTTNNYGIAFGRGNNTSNKNAGNGNQWTAANPFNAGDKVFEGGITFVLVNATAQVWAVSEDNNRADIGLYKFGGITFRKIFGIPIIPTVTLRRREFKYRSLNSYDDAPGGFDVTQRSVKDSWAGGLAGPASTLEHDGHCFLPTVSALDLQNQSYGSGNNWQSNNLFYNIDSQIRNIGTVSGNDLITPSLSPFKAVITSTTDGNAANLAHNGNINQRFATFIQRKILNANPINCAGANGLCSLNPAITGTMNDCASTFNLNPLPNDVTINWSSKYGYLSVINGQGTSAVTIKRNQNITDTLFATLTNSCGANVVVKKAITALSITITPDDSGPCGGTATVAGATGSFTWTVTGNLLINGTSTTLTTTSNQISFTGTEGLVEVTNGACLVNLSEYFVPFQPQIHFTVNPAIGGEPLSASVYPYNYGYSAIRWYLDGTLLETGTEIFYVSNPPCGNSEVKVEIDLGCGTTVTSTATFERICSWWRSMVIYPNPASSYLNIQPDAEKLKTLSATEKSAMKEYEASLYDIRGKLLLKGRSNGYRLNLDTRHLKSDYYFIHIKIDGEKEIIKKQVIIKN